MLVYLYTGAHSLVNSDLRLQNKGSRLEVSSQQ